MLAACVLASGFAVIIDTLSKTFEFLMDWLPGFSMPIPGMIDPMID
jgi:hypothetical protein